MQERSETFDINGQSIDGREWVLQVTRRWNLEGHELRRRVEVKTANGLAGCDDRENGVFALTLDPETGRENVLIYTSDQRRGFACR